jgi:hypothetical protein
MATALCLFLGPLRFDVTTNQQGKIMATATIGDLDLESAAREAAGNWQHFDCFSWHRASDLADADNWGIVYTHNRDSGLLDQSNADAIAEAMEPFTKGRNPDVVAEHHVHFAVGWVAGYSIKVFKRGRITKAFRTYFDLQQRLVDYPLLDEDDYSNRVYEATLTNIDDAAWRLKKQYDLPPDWAFAVYRWLSDHDCSELEDNDDRGGYPSELWLQRAFDALKFKRTK